MLPWVVGDIQAHKPPERIISSSSILVIRGQGELGVDETHEKPARPREGFEHVRGLDDEVHAGAEAEVVEEGDELGGLPVADDLHAREAGFELLVDRDHHAAAGNGKVGGEPASMVSGE